MMNFPKCWHPTLLHRLQRSAARRASVYLKSLANLHGIAVIYFAIDNILAPAKNLETCWDEKLSKSVHLVRINSGAKGQETFETFKNEQESH